MPEVPKVSTPLTMAGQCVLLVPLLTKGLGMDPSEGLAELCGAQLALENSNGTAVFNNNYGNVTALPSDEFFRHSTLHVDRLGHPVPAGDPSEVVMRFRAYATPLEGMQGYVAEVMKRGAMVKAGMAGDARGFAQAISDTGYTPGINVSAVAASLANKARELREARAFEFFSLAGPVTFLSDVPVPGVAPGAPPAALPGLSPYNAARLQYSPPKALGVGLMAYGALAHWLVSRGLYG